MISIAGQVLSAPTPEILSWVNANLPQDSWAFVNRAFPGYGLSSIAWPTGYRPLPCPKLHSFYWPSGASRWAMGLYLVHGLDLAGDPNAENSPGIHDAAFGPDGDQCNAVTLKMFTEDESGDYDESVSARVYCLPPIPLCRLLGSDGTTPDNASYLLTVVDQRFFWWQIPTPDFGINETAGKTWNDVFSAIGGALGVSIGADTANGAYLQPSRGLNLTYEVIPPVLDAAAASCGMRVCCSYDGSVFAQSFSTALQKLQQDASDHDQRAYVAGGNRYLSEF